MSSIAKARARIPFNSTQYVSCSSGAWLIAMQPGAFSYFSPGEDCDVFGMFGQILVVDPEVAGMAARTD